jgi:hypothetical protein
LTIIWALIDSRNSRGNAAKPASMACEKSRQMLESRATGIVAASCGADSVSTLWGRSMLLVLTVEPPDRVDGHTIIGRENREPSRFENKLAQISH